ncbi:MAG TPA: hypothetical protein VEI52_25040 [Terriglobales bacterium]|nr:hypothetical protein [Terriglobales bacterium]
MLGTVLAAGLEGRDRAARTWHGLGHRWKFLKQRFRTGRKQWNPGRLVCLLGVRAQGVGVEGKDSRPECDPTRPSVARVGDSHSLQQLVLQADPELAIGFINCTDSFDPMPTKVMSCMLKMIFRAGKRTKRSFDLRMPSPGRGW